MGTNLESALMAADDMGMLVFFFRTLFTLSIHTYTSVSMVFIIFDNDLYQFDTRLDHYNDHEKKWNEKQNLEYLQ